ncbi:MAG: PAS domain S-box protein, partial [Sneathiella sp.]|nr:PAS domain S-box protein [Sneathiella sp.]
MKLDTQLDFAPTLLKRIVHNSLNEVYVFDGETLQFLFVNRGALLNLGYSFDELRRLMPTDIKPEFSPPQFRELMQPLKDGEEEKLAFQTKHKRKDNSTYDVEVHLQYFTENGRSYFFAIILDITDAVERSVALNTALAEVKVVSRIKDNFLATMSHDLRTPLNAIIGFSQLMHNSVFGDLQNERYKDYVRDILNSANHLLSLVNQILQTSKLEAEGYKISSEVFDPVALSKIIINMFADTARDEGKHISLIKDRSAPKFVAADPEVAKVIQ